MVRVGRWVSRITEELAKKVQHRLGVMAGNDVISSFAPLSEPCCQEDGRNLRVRFLGFC